MKLAIPSYIYPDNTFWPRIVAAAPEIVVLNPKSGPGPERDPNYMRLYLSLLAKRIKVLGYVATTYGNKDTSSIRDEREKYRAFYGPFHGLFLDETESLEEFLPYYQRLCREGDVNVLNPGRMCDYAYLNTGAIVMNFEGHYENYLKFVPRWTHPNTWHCVHSVPDAAAMRSVVEKARHHRVGYLWVGSDRATYNVLPRYFEELAQLLKHHG